MSGKGVLGHMIEYLHSPPMQAEGNANAAKRGTMSPRPRLGARWLQSRMVRRRRPALIWKKLCSGAGHSETKHHMSQLNPYQAWLRVVLAPAIAVLEAQAKIAGHVAKGEYGGLNPWLPTKEQQSAPDDVVDLYPEAPDATKDAASTVPKSVYQGSPVAQLGEARRRKAWTGRKS